MAKKKTNNKRKVFIIIVGVIALLAVGLAVQGDKPIDTHKKETVNKIEANFECSESKTIKAVFVNSTDSYVQLDLSDGRKFDIPQAISADGARYANADETIVFWNKGNTATFEENGVYTYSDCVTAEN